MADRVTAGSMMEEEATFELSLRPRRIAEYIGQQSVKDNLDVAIQAARQRGEPLDRYFQRNGGTIPCDRRPADPDEG